MSKNQFSSTAHSMDSRKKAREEIENQVAAFLKQGGEIEKLAAPFSDRSDPKCRLGDEVSFFA